MRNLRARSPPTIASTKRRRRPRKSCRFTITSRRFRGRPTATYRAPRAFYSTLFKYARRLLRAADELPEAKWRTFSRISRQQRESLELDLFSSEPVHEDVEHCDTNRFAHRHGHAFRRDDPLVKQVLAGKSPVDRAAELVTGSKLKDVAVRKQLYDGGASAVAANKDPMIELARLVDGPAREARKVLEAQDEIKQQAYAEIAKARFAIEGTSTYPDATFTLRLSYGPVSGYEERETDPRAYQYGRTLSARRRTQQPAALRSPETLARPQSEIKSEHAVQLRFHRRHHRRQQRQPGREQERTSSSASFSTAIFNRWFSTAFTPTNKRGRSVSIPPRSAKRCAKSMTQPRWRMN